MERRAIGWGTATGVLAGLETALLIFGPRDEGILLAALLFILALFVAAAVVRANLFLPEVAQISHPHIVIRHAPSSR